MGSCSAQFPWSAFAEARYSLPCTPTSRAPGTRLASRLATKRTLQQRLRQNEDNSRSTIADSFEHSHLPPFQFPAAAVDMIQSRELEGNHILRRLLAARLVAVSKPPGHLSVDTALEFDQRASDLCARPRFRVMVIKKILANYLQL